MELYYKRNDWLGKEDSVSSDIVKYFRVNGFPHFKITVEQQKKDMDTMKKYLAKNNIINGDIIKQTMHCLGLCWTYHPHHWDIKCGNGRTPMEVFKDDKLLKKSILKRMKGGSHITPAMIRKNLKVSGTQTVSNFRPSVATTIYNKFAGEGNVYDPCMGFGGRLIGALCSDRVKNYTGMDPSLKTFNGLSRMAENLNNGKELNMYCQPSEQTIPNGKFDLVFTSPPYFNTEKYSDEPTQSYMKYPTYEKWFDGFLTKMIDNSLKVLKNNGYLIINIANVKNAPYLENDFTALMETYNIPLIKTYKMELSKQHSGGKFKFEPIFVYKKQ